MAVRKRTGSPKLSDWAVRIENHLLLLDKDELVELLRIAGQSVSTLKHKPLEQTRQALLALPPNTLRLALRERIRRIKKNRGANQQLRTL